MKISDMFTQPPATVTPAAPVEPQSLGKLLERHRLAQMPYMTGYHLFQGEGGWGDWDIRPYEQQQWGMLPVGSWSPPESPVIRLLPPAIDARRIVGRPANSR